ncbi:MAG: AAA family ATPase [Oscillospiraceae bacterium]|nr:AAA family ATPase [Oscillospiraceae bacterium]
MGKVLAFVSGKGGTGKTSLCAGIATCLAAMGKRVLCVDLDVGLRNLDIALGMTEEAVLPFDCLMREECSSSALSDHPRIPNLYLLTAPVNTLPEEVDADAFCAMVLRERENFDFILLDAPAGIGVLFRLCINCASEVVVVTGGDKATLRDGARAAQMIGDKPARILVNRLDPKLFRRLGETVDDIMDEVSLPLLGLVPEDRNVPLSAYGGKPLVLCSRKGAASAVLRVSRRLCDLPAPLKRK